jgi:hypothetical protein
MKRAGSGRVARKIGAFDEDSAESTDASQGGAQAIQPGEKLPMLRLPALFSDTFRVAVLTCSKALDRINTEEYKGGR